MATLCPAPDPDLGLVQNLGFTVDCNLQGTAQGDAIRAAVARCIASLGTWSVTNN